ncbi:MAG: M23 family metallopeptidase [Pseudomonadota bacterium]
MRKLATTFVGGLMVSACMTAAAPAEAPVTTPMAASAAVAATATSAALQDQRVSLRKGRLAQGGLSFWQTEPGAEVFLDKKPVMLSPDGHFALGFNRDYEGEAELLVVFANGEEERRSLPIEERSFRIERIDTLDEAKVNPYTKEQLDQIKDERAQKTAARSNRSEQTYWRTGFDWPVRGRISGKYGAQRILNGTPKRFHSGTDVAAPPPMTPAEFVGTPVRAPSTGRVTLAVSDFYFEGGMVFIDHGQEVESVLMHLSKVLVRPGQTVSKGEVIGAVGATGRATGPHLHWTVNWKGQPMDPELLVPPMPTNGQ